MKKRLAEKMVYTKPRSRLYRDRQWKAERELLRRGYGWGNIEHGHKPPREAKKDGE